MGFSVYQTGEYHYPDEGDTVVFDGILTNAGGAYSAETHTFTCPVAGYYFLYINVYALLDSGSRDYCNFDIMVEGVRMAMVS